MDSQNIVSSLVVVDVICGVYRHIKEQLKLYKQHKNRLGK
jgi:hypothetical protein